MEFSELSVGNLEEATHVAEACFAHVPDSTRPGDWFKASLAGEGRSLLEEKGQLKIGRTLCYWIAKYSGKLVGTTGLYSKLEDHEEALWVGWFCLSPEVRGLGLGNDMMLHTIEQARRRQAKILRLYTSDLPEEAAAQKLYEKHGLKIVKTEVAPRGDYQLLYRELPLVSR